MEYDPAIGYKVLENLGSIISNFGHDYTFGTERSTNGRLSVFEYDLLSVFVISEQLYLTV